MRFLAIDVGMGTQDVLLYDSEKNIENCIKMVLPSGTRIVAEKIAKETQREHDIVLAGETMGGGPCSSAIKRHIKAGLGVFATEKAALTLNDDLEKVKEMGVILVSEDEAPKATMIKMGDIDRNALEKALGLFGIDIPDRFAVAVQDHGYSPGESNRIFRFEYFKEILEKGGDLDSLVYKGNVPDRLSRMKAVERTLPGVLLMDTGTAAVRGALLDDRAINPCLVVNAGNGHTLACVVREKRLLAIFEHHTHQVTAKKLDDQLVRLCNGKLDFQEVFNDGGHGCFIKEAIGFENIGSILVTGPNRDIMRDSSFDVHFAAPFGDMMLTGCFGLVDAYLERYNT